MAIRQNLGHSGLLDFVGDIDNEARRTGVVPSAAV